MTWLILQYSTCVMSTFIITGCTPCVNDLYQDELSQWLQLKSMTIEGRQKWWREKQKPSNSKIAAALAPEQFRGYVYYWYTCTCTHFCNHAYKATFYYWNSLCS